jgi:hypothetical protein
MRNHVPVRILMSLAIAVGAVGHIAQSQDLSKGNADKFSLSDFVAGLETQYPRLAVKDAFPLATASAAKHVAPFPEAAPAPSPCGTFCRLSTHKPGNRSAELTLPVTSRVVGTSAKR